MLIYLDDKSGTAIMKILNTEAKFNKLPECLDKPMEAIRNGLLDHGVRL